MKSTQKKIEVALAVPQGLSVSKSKTQFKINNSIYLRLVREIEMNLRENKIDFQKTIVRKAEGMMPYVTLLNIRLRNIPIYIIREKYLIKICVGNVKTDNVFYFDQVLKKIIEKSIEKIEKIISFK